MGHHRMLGLCLGHFMNIEFLPITNMVQNRGSLKDPCQNRNKIFKVFLKKKKKKEKTKGKTKFKTIQLKLIKIHLCAYVGITELVTFFFSFPFFVFSKCLHIQLSNPKQTTKTKT